MSKKMLIILVSAVLVIALIGGGGLFYLKSGGSGSEKGAGTEGTENSAEKAEIDKKKTNFPLDGFIVNLSDPGGKRYLSTKIVLELSDDKSIPFVEKKVPEMRDRILMILPTKAFKDIQSAEGKNSLRTTLIAALNDILKHGKITNIFFQEFVVQ